MRVRWLVAVDVNDRGEAVVDQVVPWARRLGAVLDLVFASEWSTEGLPRPARPSEELDLLWDRWAREAEAERVRLEGLLARVPEERRGSARLVAGRPAEALLEASAGYDLLVVATHARVGLERVLLGSVTARVLRRSQLPVLVLGLGDPAPPAEGPLLIVAPTEESDPGALGWLETHLRGQRVELLHVSAGPLASPLWVLGRPRSAGPPPDREVLRALIAERAAAHGFPGVPVHVVEGAGGHPGDSVSRAVDALGADLVVIPTHQRRGLDRALLGSVAERVAERAPCPVIVVPWPRLEPAARPAPGA